MYEYKCGQCGQVFEIIQRFSDEPLTTHEGCGGSVERLISAPALQFKGSGWYITDYARGGGSKPAGESKSADKKSGGGTESKPASTSGDSSSSSSTSSTTTTTPSSSDTKK